MNGETTREPPAPAYTMGYSDEFQNLLNRRNAAANAAHLLPSMTGVACSISGGIPRARWPQSPGARRLPAIPDRGRRTSFTASRPQPCIGRAGQDGGTGRPSVPSQATPRKSRTVGATSTALVCASMRRASPDPSSTTSTAFVS